MHRPNPTPIRTRTLTLALALLAALFGARAGYAQEACDAPSTAVRGTPHTLVVEITGQRPQVGDMGVTWVRRSPGGEINWRKTESWFDGNGRYLLTDEPAGVSEYAAWVLYYDHSRRIYPTVSSPWVQINWTSPE